MKEPMNRENGERVIVFSDGSKGIKGDFPIAVEYTQVEKYHDTEIGNQVVDPIFDYHVTDNLYGRMMTLVEATTETHKLKAVKDLFSKELGAWASDVYDSAREIANGGDSSHNIYTRNRM